MTEVTCKYFKDRHPCLKGEKDVVGGWLNSWLLCYMRDSKVTELGAIAEDVNCGKHCRKESLASLEMLANGFGTPWGSLLFPAMFLNGFEDSLENREEAFEIMRRVYANQQDRCIPIRRYAYKLFHIRSIGENGLPVIPIPARLDNKLILTEKDGWLKRRMENARRRGY